MRQRDLLSISARYNKHILIAAFFSMVCTDPDQLTITPTTWRRIYQPGTSPIQRHRRLSNFLVRFLDCSHHHRPNGHHKHRHHHHHRMNDYDDAPPHHHHHLNDDDDHPLKVGRFHFQVILKLLPRHAINPLTPSCREGAEDFHMVQHPITNNDWGFKIPVNFKVLYLVVHLFRYKTGKFTGIIS